jgi:hypothetical protein
VFLPQTDIATPVDSESLANLSEMNVVTDALGVRRNRRRRTMLWRRTRDPPVDSSTVLVSSLLSAPPRRAFEEGLGGA